MNFSADLVSFLSIQLTLISFGVVILRKITVISIKVNKIENILRLVDLENIPRKNLNAVFSKELDQ